ncbi:MAG: hypothetical protein LBH26_08435, partial [Treponema sp.]|nr:hypothetical protein [Treponema sp.]
MRFRAVGRNARKRAAGLLSFALAFFPPSPSFLPGQASAVSAPALLEAPGEPDGELVLRAYQYSYPDKIAEVAYRDGDWTITIGGETFYWAGGRLLPPSLRGEAESWAPHSYDSYPSRPLSPEIYSPAYVESLRRQGDAESAERDRRYRGFQGKLYGGLSRREAEAYLERIRFLGRNLTVHRDIVQALGRVEASVNKKRRGEPGDRGLCRLHRAGRGLQLAGNPGDCPEFGPDYGRGGYPPELPQLGARRGHSEPGHSPKQGGLLALGAGSEPGLDARTPGKPLGASGRA